MADVPSVRRAVSILRQLSGANRPMGAGMLAQVLGIPRSSVYDVLAVLEDLGLVIKSSTGYLLGAGVQELGSAYMRTNPLQRLAAPLVRDLATETGGTAQLAVLRGWETVYLVKEQSLQSVAVITATGVRMPAYLTATGRAIMASMDPKEVRALLAEESGLVSRTGRGPRDLRALAESLRQVRARGYSLEVGEITPEIWTVAASVHDAIERPIAAIGLCLRSPAEASDETIDEDEVEQLATRVRAAAGELTRRLRS